MPANIHTAELIDIFTTKLEPSDPKYGIFIVMEYFENDLKKVMSLTPGVEFS